jgi:hypothetical protein
MFGITYRKAPSTGRILPQTIRARLFLKPQPKRGVQRISPNVAIHRDQFGNYTELTNCPQAFAARAILLGIRDAQRYVDAHAKLGTGEPHRVHHAQGFVYIAAPTLDDAREIATLAGLTVT